MLIGLQTMEAEKLNHYDIYCPKCRRANRVERKKLERANPNWQESLKQMAKDVAKAEKESAASAKEVKPAPKKKAAPKQPAAKSKAKTSSAKKSAATSSSKGKKKTTAKSKAKTK
jgi:hypothetical protein